MVEDRPRTCGKTKRVFRKGHKLLIINMTFRTVDDIYVQLFLFLYSREKLPLNFMCC